jgi:16S rRNA C967 or C1407 C5-methylase (RsmB/RsmF family)
MINQRFIDYFRDNFFRENPRELEDFICSIELPIARTIRINPDRIEAVKWRLEQDGWILHPTNISSVFSLDRREDFDPLERRIGFSLDHLLGNFYIQELAAAHPVDILAEWTIHDEEFLILDLASSPGGKTTQLAEYYPNSFIIANEPTRERIPQLLQNLERMSTPNVAITLYPGQQWKHFPETFDRILLDAPCSGEWTLYKGTDAVKHWHIKNIKQIVHLQEKLLDAALHSLKVGGEMIYSTCALNLLENEGVIESIEKKYPWSFEILFEKKFWPHIDKTGWFFVTMIKKLCSISGHSECSEESMFLDSDQSYKKKQFGGHKSSNTSLKRFHGKLWNWEVKKWITLYEHEGKILAVKNAGTGEKIRENIFPMRWGEYIGNMENGKLVPNTWAFRVLETNHLERCQLQNEQELDAYLRENSLESTGKDGYIILEFKWVPISLEQRKNGIISSTFPKDWQRR